MKSKFFILALLIVFTSPLFAQRPDMNLIPYRQGDLWGFANSDKTIAIKPEFEEVGFFYEGYAVAKKGGKYGYINKTGKVVIPFKFLSAKHFRFGYMDKGPKTKIVTGDDLVNNEKAVLFAGASVRSDGYEICINTKGETMPKCPAIPENSAPDLNKKTTVSVTSNYSTIQKSDLYDKIMSDYKMPGAEDSYYIATRAGKYGVFNKTFEVIVPFEYDKIEKLDIGVMPYLLVEKNGLKGLMFGNGSLYMAVENTRLDLVKAADSNNYMIFTKDGKTGIKNTKYKVVLEPNYADVSYDENGGFELSMGKNNKGFYFLNGNILEPKYAEVKPIKGAEYVMIKTAVGKTGYISNNLVEFFEE